MKILSSLLLSSFLAVAITGCTCKPPPSTSLTPDFKPDPAGLTFSACPSTDETGKSVVDVFPDTKKLTISNTSRVASELTLTFSGPGKGNFSLGTPVPKVIEGLGNVEIPILFSPAKKGGVKAELIIADNSDVTDDEVVALTGEGVDLLGQPTIETGVPLAGGGFSKCTEASAVSDCQLQYPDTMVDQSSTMQIKIRNKGCPALKITKLEIIPNSDTSLDTFTIESPALLPTESAPLVLSQADGTAEVTITVRFNAKEGVTADALRSAVLSIVSNDPRPDIGDGTYSPASIALEGNAIKPDFYVSPPNCNFTKPWDAATNSCGNLGGAVPHKANFAVKNSGTTPITIAKVSFHSSGGTSSSDNRFIISKTIQGSTIAAGSEGIIEVTETDAPILVSDQLEIDAGAAGKVFAAVISGVKPCLTAAPIDTIDFGDPADELTTKVLKLSNGAGCGVLVINSVNISSQNRFSLLAPLIAPNSSLPAGQSVETTVQYQRPPSGGSQTAELTVATNDPDYKPLLMILTANAAHDDVPAPLITACSPTQLTTDAECMAGAQGLANYALSTINPDEITISGVNSTDDKVVTAYTFTLLSQPMGVTEDALVNNKVKSASNLTTLKIPSGGLGAYKVKLDVWDDRGQKSPTPSLITITISP